MRKFTGWRTRTASALVALLSLAPLGCGESVDANALHTDLITVEAMRVERVVSDESALFFIDIDLRNRTNNTVNNFYWARVQAGSASAEFNLTHNQEPFTLIGCLRPEPFDVPPGQVKTTRMRVDLRTDRAQFGVTCEFDPSLRGFTSSQSRQFEAARAGAEPPSDFHGPLELELKGSMNAQCRPGDCGTHALVVASSEVSVP
ncbi:MAG TPA: hypothetical protein VER96_31750 [Polyangiaceae bacterium]|nr:hypothetical protein [Polyangiaceae bacterium]